MTLKQRLAAGKPAVGGWITLAHPGIAEIMARAGFDWVAVDLEHSVIGVGEAEQLIRAVDLCGVPALARLTSNDPDQIKRALDAGAKGVIVPLIKSAQEARQAVDAVYYPPRGSRGVGLARAQGYGTRFKEYAASLEREAVVVVMIEHIDAVELVDEILAVEGVDAYFLGPYDLSASLGLAGQLTHPKVEAAVAKVRAAGKRLGKAGGIHVIEPDPAALKSRLRQGFTFVAYSLDIRMIDSACRAGLKISHDRA